MNSILKVANLCIFELDLSSDLLSFRQPTRDEFGAAIALFTARLHNPEQSSHQAVLKALIFQLDIALERFASCLTYQQ